VVVQRNFAAVDATLAHLYQVAVPASPTASRHKPAAVPADAPDFVKRVEDLLIVRLVPRIVEHLAIAHDALFVDHEDGAFGDAFEADHVLVEYAVVANRLFVEVAQ